MNNDNDSQLVKRIQADDETAFAELVENYQQAIHGYAYHITQDSFAAEDITQEVFWDAYLNLHTLQNPDKLGAWLRSITHHKSIDWLRRHQEVSLNINDLPSASWPSIPEILEHKETYEQLYSIITTLSEPNRIVIILKYMEGLNNSQIADFLEVSPSVVSTRLERARKQLQERMLTALEVGFPQPDFVEPICRQIQGCRPLIGVGLQFSADHGPIHLCTCAFRVRALARQTGGVYQEYPNTGFAIWYGINQIQEYDIKKALKTALELQAQSCPAGPFSLSIRQVLDRGSENCPRFPYLIEEYAVVSAPNNIVVDSSIAWLLRGEFRFERIQRSGQLLTVYRLILNSPIESLDTDILVGRQTELAQLEDVIQRLFVGVSGIIRVTGEAGIGKTHLLRALRNRYEGESLIWLEGKVNPGESYQPICEAIQSHFAFKSVDELKEHLTSLGLEKALPYFVELLGLPFESTDKKFNTLTVEQIYHRAFEYMRDWLIRLAEEIPVVWVIDDTHWLSPEASRGLQYLCRITRDSPALFLFSRRSGYEQVAEAEHGIELEKEVAQRYSEAYQAIDLKPLSVEASRSLLSHFLGHRKILLSEFNRVLGFSVGNPLYLREVAQFLPASPDSINIPPGVERLILANLDRLSPVHQSLLRYASVLGSHVDVTLLQNAFPQIELSSIYEQLREMGWLQLAKEETEPIPYLDCNSASAPKTNLLWRHDLYREAIYNNIQFSVRRQLHAEIAGQLEQSSETPPDVLAEHYEAAGNHEKATHYACFAAAMYHHHRQHRRVRRYAEMALSRVEMLSPKQQVEINYQYAYSLKLTRYISRAIPYFEQALKLAHTNNQRVLINIRLLECTERKRSIALWEEALSLIDESTENGVIIAACQIGIIDNVPNPDLAKRVLHLTQKLKERKPEAWALRLLALAQAAAGNLDDAWCTIQHAIRVAAELDENSLLAELEFSAAKILRESSRSSEALNHLNRALHLWESTEEWYTIGQIHRELGQYQSMVEAFENLLEQLVLSDSRHDISDVFAHLVQGYAYQGDWEKAYHYFWQMLDSMDSHPPDIFFEVEEAVGALCHKNKTNHCWIWQDVPQTMTRAQELIRCLHEHCITAEELYKRLRWVLHPILVAGYVEYGVKHSHEEGVAMIRLLARQVWILDEHVQFWAYLTDILDYDTLESVFEDALKRIQGEEPILLNEGRPEFFLSKHSEKAILEWLRACLRERYETDDIGKHLRQMGIIPEPCWLITGTFQENVPSQIEREILNVVFNPTKKTRSLQLKWQTPDDFRDGYVDYLQAFQTMDRVSAYACTTILSPSEQQVQFTAYHDDSIRVWLNGESCFESGNCSYSQFDGVLKEGRNLVLIRLTNFEDGWGFILRVTDKDGEMLENLSYIQPHLR